MDEPIPADPFAYYVTEPLLAVLGQRLRTVEYVALGSDYPNFTLDDSNVSGGCQKVRLVFDYGTIDLNWNGITGLRDEYYCYHITTRANSVPLLYPTVGSTWKPDENAYGLIPANIALLWKNHIGERLSAVTVWGTEIENGISPQAVAFRFPEGEVVITVGYTNQPPKEHVIENGDELLLFSIDEWLRNGLTGQGVLSLIVPVWHRSF